jgi:excinuclease ABC subunit A
MSGLLRLRGARQNTLRSVDLDLPLGQLIAFVGVSGSGKSSLAFETLHAEGRRRFVETLSPSLRGLLEAQPRPDFDSLTGLPPTVGVAQSRGERPGGRSTVGTLTDLQQLLGVLLSRLGVQHCPGTDQVVRPQAADEILAEILALPAGARLVVMAPMRRDWTGDLRILIDGLLAEGFSRVRLNGEIRRIEDLDPNERGPLDLDLVLDRIRIAPEREPRLAEAVRTALSLGRGRLLALVDQVEHSWMELPWCPGCEAPLPLPTPRLFSHFTAEGACPTCSGLGQVQGQVCSDCDGSRLSAAPRHVRLDGKGPAELLALPLSELAEWLPERADPMPEVRRELDQRLRFLLRLGLGYLSLDRASKTLSAGELQRLRLAALAASPLSGVLYVLDEPTAGLHPSDARRLVELLRELRDAGNTVLVVEHDPVVVAAADHVVEFGPGSGAQGGQVLFQGTPSDLLHHDTPTGRWLSGREPAPEPQPPERTRWIHVVGASGRTLDVTARVLRGGLTVVTGPSGAGKSTLVLDTLVPALKGEPGLPLQELRGNESILKVVQVEPGGAVRQPRSVPATFLGIWDPLRRLLAATREARIAGFSASHFGLTRGKGLCGRCTGLGQVQLDQGFLPDVWVDCPLCDGARFDRAALRVRWRGTSAADLLRLSVREARSQFAAQPKIASVLRVVDEAGLGYLPLGQPTRTLSGGELQRLRLARGLTRARNTQDQALYVLDEPCSGLHPRDVASMVRLVQQLTRAGATVVAIAHHPLFIRCADHELALDQGTLTRSGRPRPWAGTPAEP